MFIFALLDRKAGAFLRPHAQESEGQAVRSIVLALRQGNNNLADFPEDFSLYEVGSFDVKSGEVTPITPPRHVVNVANLVTAASAPAKEVKNG